jgi:hypothetical protein
LQKLNAKSTRRGYSIKKAEHTPYQGAGMDRDLYRAVGVPEGVEETCVQWPEPGKTIW